MQETVVDRLYQNFQDILSALESLRPPQPSLHISAGEVFSKALMVAAASYFESEIPKYVERMVEKYSDGDLIIELVRQKAN